MRNSCTYKICGTETFRLSSCQILVKKQRMADGSIKRKGWGSNLQNIEKSMRKIYVPDDGKIFVQVDQAGAEALIVAYLGRDGKYRSLFKNGIKPHTYICLFLFKDVWPKKMRELGLITGDMKLDMDEILRTPIPELKKNPLWKSLDQCIKDSDNWSMAERYYYLGKMTEHSSNYDIQPPLFRMNVLTKSGGMIYISKDDSERFIGTKHALYPEIKEDFHEYVKKCVRDNRMLYNLHGHPYVITAHEIQESDWKKYYAWINQSTVGQITNIAYTRMFEFIQQENLKWDLLANTHDSYMLQVPIDEAKACAIKGQEFMAQSFTSPFDGTEFCMKSEAQAGFNWAPAKKDNPAGLKGI